MRKVLVGSRSFGNVVTIGNDLLQAAGFSVHRVREEDRPPDDATLASIVSREHPEVLIPGAEPLPESVLAASDDPRMIMKHGVGVDNTDLGAATSRALRPVPSSVRSREWDSLRRGCAGSPIGGRCGGRSSCAVASPIATPVSSGIGSMPTSTPPRRSRSIAPSS